MPEGAAGPAPEPGAPEQRGPAGPLPVDALGGAAVGRVLLSRSSLFNAHNLHMFLAAELFKKVF